MIIGNLLCILRVEIVIKPFLTGISKKDYRKYIYEIRFLNNKQYTWFYY